MTGRGSGSEVSCGAIVGTKVTSRLVPYSTTRTMVAVTAIPPAISRYRLALKSRIPTDWELALMLNRSAILGPTHSITRVLTVVLVLVPSGIVHEYMTVTSK